MYLNMLKHEEKSAFYSLAHALAVSHEGISEAEHNVLNSTLQEMGISKPAQLLDVKEACTVFVSNASKRIALLELLLIALVDDDFADDEETMVSKIVDYFGFDASNIDRAASWAESILAGHRSGLRFIQG
jgi:hypothetical protein